MSTKEEIKERAEDKANVQNNEVKSKDNEVKSENNTVKTKKKNPVVKVISNVIQTIIWILIVLLLGLLVLTTASQKTDVFGYRLYLIMSGSMEPTIHVKQAIITKQVDEPKLGDVIAFGENNVITVHRIIEVYNQGDVKQYKTKGDNNNTEDSGLVQKEHIKGVVKYRLPFVGEAILFLQSHLIVVFLAIGILVIIILIRRLI